MKNYIKPTAPGGFWWGIYANAGLSVDWGIAFYVAGAGINAGYKYLLPKNFIAEWSLGLMYLYRTSQFFAIGGISPSVRFKLGYAF